MQNSNKLKVTIKNKTIRKISNSKAKHKVCFYEKMNEFCFSVGVVTLLGYCVH